MAVPAAPPPAVPRPADGAVPARNGYVDLVRLVAIGAVVFGHWLDTTVVLTGGRPAGQSALAVVGYTRWFTLPLQVMPLFFLAGGYAAAASWQSWTRRGGGWSGWAYGRVVRLLRPTGWYLLAVAAAALLAQRSTLDRSVLTQAGWGLALHLWFLPVYLLLLLLAVPLLAAWRRVGWLLPAAGAAAVAAVDLADEAGHLPAAGWANYLLAWGSVFCLGIAWQADALAGRRRAAALAAGGLLALLGLVTVLRYPPWMVGVPGERVANTAPPTVALLAYAVAQTGVVLLVQPAGQAWLRRPRAVDAVRRGNAVIMTVYLWHMVPVLVLAAALDAAGLLPGPAAGTGRWWLLRPLWMAALAVLLAALVPLVSRFERQAARAVAANRAAAGALVIAAAALAGWALDRLAVSGFTPAGHLAAGPLAAYAAGALAIALAGRVPAKSAEHAGPREAGPGPARDLQPR